MAISSRSANERQRPDGGFDDCEKCVGGMPPAPRNHLTPTAGDTPASTAASSLERPEAIALQNCLQFSRWASGGRPGDRKAARTHRSERRPYLFIATSFAGVLRRPVESALGRPVKPGDDGGAGADASGECRGVFDECERHTFGVVAPACAGDDGTGCLKIESEVSSRQNENGGRTRDRTLDLSRVKGTLSR